MKLKVKDISKNYNRYSALRGVNLELEPGLYGLLGPNGAGKTTLMELIWSGAPGIRLVPKAKVGFFRQGLETLDLNKTVLENVMETSVQSENTMRGILARLLIRREDVFKKAGDLSGGERVKLAFAKLFGSPANLLLLDEPSLGLAPIIIQQIFQIIQRNNKSLVVVVNKWDLVENKDQVVIKTFENAIRERMAPFVDFPIIFASALTKQRIFKVLEMAKNVYLNRKSKVGTAKLNEVMLPLIEAYPPPSVKGKYIKIKYCTQLPNTQIPSFVFYANLPQYVKEPYRRFLENKIRENWPMHGCPINVFIRQK